MLKLDDDQAYIDLHSEGVIHSGWPNVYGTVLSMHDYRAHKNLNNVLSAYACARARSMLCALYSYVT